MSNIWSIGGGKGGSGKSFFTGNLAHEQKMKLMRNIARLSYDYILLDLGAGTSFNTIDYFMISNLGIFVTTPEPTSIENIYRLIRSVYFRKIRQILRIHDFRILAEKAGERDSRAVVSNPDILLNLAKELDPEKGDSLEKALGTLHFKLAVNQQRKQDNPNVGELICKIIERHLALKMSFTGNISFDDHVHNSVCKKVPFVDLYPYTQTTLDLRECCKHLLSINERQTILQNAAE